MAKIIISIEDIGGCNLKVVSTPSFAELAQRKKQKQMTYAHECAMFVLIKIIEAHKAAKAKSNVIIPPYGVN